MCRCAPPAKRIRHVIAFARSFRGVTVVVLAGRFFTQLEGHASMPLGAETWGDTEVILRKQLPAGEYRDVFTGKTVSPVPRDGDFALPVAGTFAHLPIAMLVNVQSKAEGPTDVR